MDDADAQRQIQQMVNFILNEARDKSQEIEAKALEDFNIEKLKLMQQMKDKVRQDFQKKAKQMEVQRAIARSSAINKARLKKIAARQKVIEDIQGQTATSLANINKKDPAKYRSLLIELIVQSALCMLEDSLYVRCREEDKATVEGLLKDAEKRYAEVIFSLAGARKTIKFEIDYQNLLPAATRGKQCSGGVVLTTKDRRISCDNTLDARLDTAVRQCLPQIREILFPVK